MSFLEKCGFGEVEQVGFCESNIPDYREPLHVKGLEPVWQNLNQEFYRQNNLVHYYDDALGKYQINFKVTGFDRDPLTSLIIEARKAKHIDRAEFQSMNLSKKNYNRYGQSLMKEESFQLKTKLLSAISKVIDGKNF